MSPVIWSHRGHAVAVEHQARGEAPGTSMDESAQLRAALNRIKRLEEELRATRGWPRRFSTTPRSAQKAVPGCLDLDRARNQHPHHQPCARRVRARLPSSPQPITQPTPTAPRDARRNDPGYPSGLPWPLRRAPHARRAHYRHGYRGWLWTGALDHETSWIQESSQRPDYEASIKAAKRWAGVSQSRIFLWTAGEFLGDLGSAAEYHWCLSLLPRCRSAPGSAKKTRMSVAMGKGSVLGCLGILVPSRGAVGVAGSSVTAAMRLSRTTSAVRSAPGCPRTR